MLRGKLHENIEGDEGYATNEPLMFRVVLLLKERVVEAGA